MTKYSYNHVLSQKTATGREFFPRNLIKMHILEHKPLLKIIFYPYNQAGTKRIIYRIEELFTLFQMTYHIG